MKKFSCLFLITIISLSFSSERWDQPFKYFMKPRPIESYNKDTLIKATDRQSPPAYWEFKPTVQIPALKLKKSDRPDAMIDVILLTSTGGGITYQRTYLKNGKNESNISFSALILLSGNTADSSPIDISFGFTIGTFNQLVQIGFGYDAGKIENSNRFFGMLSVGLVKQN